jgi:mono/diheme cytochrome c family protein
MERRRGFLLSRQRSRHGARHGVRPHGRGGRPQLQPDGSGGYTGARDLSAEHSRGSSEPATIAPPAPASPKEGGAVADALGRKVFAQACVSCHSWTGVSALSPFATISGSRAVNDATATNVAQIVISGTRRFAPDAMSMPAFGSTYSDTEIAAVANYVTGRFGRVQTDGKGRNRSSGPDRPLSGVRSS